MNARGLLLLFVSVFVFCGFYSNARICENVYIHNSLEVLEQKLRGCTAVVGFLKIVLLEYPGIHFHDNLTYPELTEVTGYVLLYRVYHLKSIGQLFPNLAAIRGDIVFGHHEFIRYAFVIYELPDLQEINLHNLRYIGGGSTRIGRCQKLCFVDTIDWSIIGSPSHELHYYNENVDDCQECPKHCNDFCWNRTHCQLTQVEDCDPDCIRCSESNPDVCTACKSLSLEKGKCVSQCPQNKFPNLVTHTCVTENECLSILKGKWWIFQGQCMDKCPTGYLKVSAADGWCSYCGNNCKKFCSGGYITYSGDANYFRNCTYINGSITINSAENDLVKELEENLQNVEEIEDYLLIERCDYITSLNFLKKLKIIHGKHLFNDRYALAVMQNKNIRKLWDYDNFTLEIKRGTIAFHYNALLCPSVISELLDISGLSHNYTNIDISPYSNGYSADCNFIAVNVTIIKLTSTSVVLEWNDLAVKADDNVVGYVVHYAEDPFGNRTFDLELDYCSFPNWVSKFVSHKNSHLDNLFPQTEYVFYIQVYTFNPSVSGKSAVERFRTLSGEPPPPTDVTISAPTTNSILLSWNAPNYPTDDISHYEIIVFLEEDDQDFFAQNSYCSYGNRFALLEDDYIADEDTPLEVWTNNTDCCKKQNWKEWESNNKMKRSLIVEPKSNEIRIRRSQSTETKLNKNKRLIIVNSTEYELQSLHHYRIYILLLKVCNKFSSCSSDIMLFQRTQPKQNADDIPPGLFVAVKKYDVNLKWLEPTDPNSVILSYIVEYGRSDLYDLSNTSKCIPRQDYLKHNYGYTIKNLLPGTYFLQVTAVSLAGPGKPIKTNFEIKLKNLILEYMTAGVAIYILIFLGLYCNYRRNKKNWSLFSYTSLQLKEPICIEDQFELSRSDIITSAGTDNFNFGLICNGFIKTQNRPCTIKVFQEHMSRHELITLLKETEATKTLSYHVVSLLGFVSKGEPALIAMELMAWGDLKSFLRQSRNSDNAITSVEMYRMAAEIADGMMYLNYKKIVHRDLAARNCMVSAGHTVKIVNFGIAKDIYKTDYYQKDNHESIPVRWMAPESLADGIFTDYSNVWSYGIVLWEIVTFAEQPYQDLSDEEVQRFVIGQKILAPPTGGPDLLYEMMVACWRWRPKNRPVFADLLKQLQSNVRRDFRLVSFYHSRGAKEYKKSSKSRKDNPPIVAEGYDKKKPVRWNKQDDEVHLLSSHELSGQNDQDLASTSSNI